MNRLYGFDDTQRTNRILRALLPEGVTATATVANKGWELTVIVCGRTECKTYHFNTGLEDKHLLRLADWWKTGAEVVNDMPAIAAKTAPSVTTADGLANWHRMAKKGEKAVYFRGQLAQFRFDASKRIVALMAEIDGENSEYQSKATERAELQAKQDTVELLHAIEAMQQHGAVELIQERLSDGTGATYFAIKR